MSHRGQLFEYAQRWGVVLGADIIETPRGILGFGTRDGDPVVLKIPRSGTGEGLAAFALQHFGSEASVRLIESADDGTVLLERAMPGTHLTNLVLDGSDDRATETLCKIMAAIHKPPPLDARFPLIENWGSDFDRYRAGGDQGVAPNLVQRLMKCSAA